jgi:hypothetical protein
MERTSAVAGSASHERVSTSPRAFCGASSEPLYRTMDEAHESGLEVCDSCVADYRKQQRPTR